MSWIRQDKLFGGIPTGGTVDFAFADLTPETVIVGLTPARLRGQRALRPVRGLGAPHRGPGGRASDRPGPADDLHLPACAITSAAHPVATLMMRDMITRIANSPDADPASGTDQRWKKRERSKPGT